MPFMLHPSGYCVYYHDAAAKNLKPGEPCLFCGRVAGHARYCQLFVEKENENKVSRVKLFDRAAVLFHTCPSINFFTFTLPSRPGEKTYQISSTCPDTGDQAVTANFSMLLENVSINIKRSQGEKFSYVWVSEAQMERQEKYGGIGDLHFHLVTGNYIPIQWLNDHWAGKLGVQSKSCVHVDHIPKTVNTLPNYLSKYMGKGSQRRILSRRFSATRDLSRFAPIRFDRLPAGTIEKEAHFSTPSGYECSMYYYNTAECLQNYAEMMHLQALTPRHGNDKNFSESAIAFRADRRKQAQKSREISPLFPVRRCA